MTFKGYSLLILLTLATIIASNENVKAQGPPVISYPTPQVYKLGTTIAPLSPTNTGGAVSPVNYNSPAIFTLYFTPFSIATDGLNNVYTTNNYTGDLTKYSSAGAVLFTIKTGNPETSEIAVDGLGNIYIYIPIYHKLYFKV
jgi:hypothetical protein